VAVVALALVGRGVGAPDAAPVDLAADVARAAPTALIADPTPSASPSPGWRSDWPATIRGAQRLASDGYVNRFTIDDVGSTAPAFVTTPPWVHALGVIGRDRSDPFQR
jgi:hypothetical protein